MSSNCGRRTVKSSMDTLFESVNVLGEPLESCSDEPKTGFFRDG
ncbi:MAG: DUF2237 family protein, partial [Gammaproteobacteria bacterium]